MAAWHHCRAGLPGVVFICCGDNGAGGAPPTLVITSSQDNWGGYAMLCNWAGRVRQTQRRNVPPVLNPVPPGPLRRNVTAMSVEVRVYLNAAVAAMMPAPGAAGPMPGGPVLSAARNNVLANWHAGLNHLGAAANQAAALCASNRLLEVSKPMHCPTFLPKERCLRCQALFRYGVIPAVGALEVAAMPRWTTRAVRKWYCAETIADHCCRAAQGGAANH